MKQLNIFFAAILSLFAVSASAQNEFTVKGHLKGVEDGTIIMLMQQMGNVGMSVVNDTVRNERFSLTWNGSGENEKYSLSVQGEGFPPMGLDIWTKAGAVIEVSGNDKYIYTWDVKSKIPEQADRAGFVNASREDWIEIQRLSAQRNALYKNIENITQEEYAKIRVVADSLDKLSDPISNRINLKEVELLLKDDVITTTGLDVLRGLTLAVKYGNDSTLRPQVEAVYAKLSDEQKNSREGKIVFTNLFPPQVVQVGEQMADANLFDLEGKQSKLSDYKGKYILLDFWSTGCGPCIMAMPEMKELAEEYKDRLTIISLSVDNEKAWRIGSASHGFTWLNLSDKPENSGIAAKYGVDGIPHYVIITADGTVSDTWIGYGKGSLRNKMKEHIE